jgi:hypothetical protein
MSFSRTPLAGNFASHAEKGNRASAEFFKRQALDALRQAQRMMGRAEQANPGCTDSAYVSATRAVMILEATEKD